MSRTLKLMIGTCAALFAVGSARASRASVLLLDYGPTTVSGASLTNSPGYAAGAWTYTTPTWNSASILDGSPVPDVTSGLSYADGSSATGVELDLAAAVGTGNATSGGTPPATLSFGDSTHQPSSSNALGSSASGGVYAGTSVGTDGIFDGGIGAISAIGLNITGLAPGTYNIFVTGRNTNGQGSVGFADSFWVNATNIGEPTGISELYTIPSTSDPSFQVASNPVGSPTTWTAGVDYIEETVTLTSSDPSLTIVTEGQSAAGSNEGRGFLNSVEVVSATPEPTSLGLFAVAAGGLLARRRRHA